MIKINNTIIMPNPLHPYTEVLKNCEQHQATLVVVSKTRPIDRIMELYQWGQRVFAENRVQELLEKAPQLPADIEWHLIGHLQTNKVRSVLPHVKCIQSLDRMSLWEKINDEASRLNLRMDCLLEIKIATEETKHGWNMPDLEQALQAGTRDTLQYVNITGVMGMASLTEDMEQVRKEMRMLRSHFHHLKQTYFVDHPEFTIISMGMSGDYQVALEEGSTMVRVGSLVFP
jgi:pyridoxal phosphate enzyme (YggS family)